MEDITQYLQLGTTGAIFAWFIYQYFQSQKAKKEPFNGSAKLILDELQKQNTNHLEHIQSGITDGFSKLMECQNNSCKEIVRAINEMHIDIVKEIGKK